MSTVSAQHTDTAREAAAEDAAPHRAGTTRRTALAGAGLLAGGTVLLTACGGSDAGGTGADQIDAANPVDIAAASDVPVGGVIKASANGHTAMVSQPTKGEFKAFSAKCTHQGCIVNAQNDQDIVCPCHSSKFSPKDGSVEGGPANSPLPAYQVKVEKGRVLIHS